MYQYTEKIWAWLAIQSLRAKFYSMMGFSHACEIAHSVVHVINRVGLWIETKLLRAAAFFFKNS